MTERDRRDPFPPIGTHPGNRLIDPREIDWSKPIPVSGVFVLLGHMRVSNNGDLVVGGPESTDSQFFVENTLQHINMRETDDADYPDITGILDINGGVMRLLWSDTTGGSPVFTTIAEMGQDGSFDFKGAVEVQAEPAYLFKERVIFTSSGTFTKADYPGLRAVHVRVTGGGASGGGAVTTGGVSSGLVSAGGGGGGGGYSESFLLAAAIDAAEAVTVGAGASGNTGAAGSDGSDSVFDTIAGEVRGHGGTGGPIGSAVGPTIAVLGGAGGTATGGLINVGGGAGGRGLYLSASTARAGGEGGAAAGPFGGGMAAPNGGNANGSSGRQYGGGGSGASNAQGQSTERAGGAGADGVVVVDVYV